MRKYPIIGQIRTKGIGGGATQLTTIRQMGGNEVLNMESPWAAGTFYTYYGVLCPALGDATTYLPGKLEDIIETAGTIDDITDTLPDGLSVGEIFGSNRHGEPVWVASRLLQEKEDPGDPDVSLNDTLISIPKNNIWTTRSFMSIKVDPDVLEEGDPENYSETVYFPWFA